MTNHGGYSFEEFVACLEAVRAENPEDNYTVLELLSMAVEAAGLLPEVGWKCFSCGEDAFDMGEDYYVQDDLWSTYGVEGVLCISCLETRMGRKLTPEDFYGSHEPTKQEAERIRNWRSRMGYTPSERLLDRCGGDYPGRDGYVQRSGAD